MRRLGVRCFSGAPMNWICTLRGHDIIPGYFGGGTYMHPRPETRSSQGWWLCRRCEWVFELHSKKYLCHRSDKDFEAICENIELTSDPRSSNGKTLLFGSGYRGSNPCRGTKMTIYIAPIRQWWCIIMGHAWGRPTAWLTGHVHTCMTCRKWERCDDHWTLDDE